MSKKIQIKRKQIIIRCAVCCAGIDVQTACLHGFPRVSVVLCVREFRSPPVGGIWVVSPSRCTVARAAHLDPAHTTAHTACHTTHRASTLHPTIQNDPGFIATRRLLIIFTRVGLHLDNELRKGNGYFNYSFCNNGNTIHLECLDKALVVFVFSTKQAITSNVHI